MSSPSVYLLASIRLGNLVVIHSSDAGTRGLGEGRLSPPITDGPVKVDQYISFFLFDANFSRVFNISLG